jgi:hypothetical protein
MEATALGDVRVAMFILLQERMGRDPARTLADGVIAANKRAAQPAPAPRTPSPSSRARRPSDDPDLRTMQRVESRLRGELQQEHAAVHAAVAVDEPAADPSPSVTPRLEQGAHQPIHGEEPDPTAAPVEPGHDEIVARAHRTRRSPRSAPRALPSYEQARAIEGPAPLEERRSR